MAKSYFSSSKKSGFMDGVGKVLKKGALWLGLAGTAGGTGYYHFHTNEVVATVRDIETNEIKDKGGKVTGYEQVIRTDKGAFRNEKSRLSVKDMDDVKDIKAAVEKGKAYKFEYYGEIEGKVPLWRRNIVKVEDATAPVTLSGKTGVFSTVVNGEKVELTVPVEVMDKIKDVKLTPVANAAAAPTTTAPETKTPESNVVGSTPATTTPVTTTTPAVPKQ